MNRERALLRGKENEKGGTKKEDDLLLCEWGTVVSRGCIAILPHVVFMLIMRA